MTEAVAAQPRDLVNAFLHRNDARAALCAVRITVSWRVLGRPHQVHIDTHRLGFLDPAAEGGG